MSVVLRNTISATLSYQDIVYARPKSMEYLVTAIIRDQLETRVDLLIDGQCPGDGELTRSQVVNNLMGVKSDAAEMVAEMIATLQCELADLMSRANVNINVKGLAYDAKGYLDEVSSELTVTFSEKIV